MPARARICARVCACAHLCACDMCPPRICACLLVRACANASVHVRTSAQARAHARVCVSACERARVSLCVCESVRVLTDTTRTREHHQNLCHIALFKSGEHVFVALSDHFSPCMFLYLVGPLCSMCLSDGCLSVFTPLCVCFFLGSFLLVFAPPCVLSSLFARPRISHGAMRTHKRRATRGTKHRAYVRPLARAHARAYARVCAHARAHAPLRACLSPNACGSSRVRARARDYPEQREKIIKTQNCAVIYGGVLLPRSGSA